MDSLEESLFLQLSHPFFGAFLRKVVLIVLVEHQPDELTVALGLRFNVVVSFCGGVSHAHLAALGLEAVVKFASGIAVKVTVRLLVATAEDSYLGVLQVEVGEGAVKPCVPRGSRALGVFAGVPGWC